MRRLLVLGPILLALGLSASGCMLFTTKNEGDQLKRQVIALGSRLDQMKQREKAFFDALKKAKGELGELKDLLPKARTILLRNSARFGAQLERVISTVSKIQGRLENIETDQGGTTKGHKALKAQVDLLAGSLSQVRTELTRLMTEVRKTQKPEPKTAAEMYAQATIARLSGRGATARALYAMLIHRFPKDRRAEAAYYWTAQSQFDEFNYPKAVGATIAQLKAFPNGPLAPKARLLSARSYFELKLCPKAIRILAGLVRRYPNADVTPAARTLLLRLRRVQNVSRYCRR